MTTSNINCKIVHLRDPLLLACNCHSCQKSCFITTFHVSYLKRNGIILNYFIVESLRHLNLAFIEVNPFLVAQVFELIENKQKRLKDVPKLKSICIFVLRFCQNKSEQKKCVSLLPNILKEQVLHFDKEVEFLAEKILLSCQIENFCNITDMAKFLWHHLKFNLEEGFFFLQVPRNLFI